jgi:hypothetical protein
MVERPGIFYPWFPWHTSAHTKKHFHYANIIIVLSD